MQLEPHIKEFIRDNLDVFDEERYQELYDYLESYPSIFPLGKSGVITQVTQFLLSCGIHPDEYMKRLPRGFLRHAQINEYSIAEGVETIGEGAFADSTIKTIRFPDSLISVEGSTFRECQNLDTVIFGKSLTSVGWGMFYNCESLKHITVPESLNEIPFSFVNDCKNLESITIPTSVKSIEPFALSNCYKLKRIAFRGTENQWKRIKKDKTWNENTKGYEIIFNYTGV